jgi:predicted phage terminase large subunit-like protein
VKLTGPLVEAFAGAFLSPMYDTASPTPDFHREGWNLYCTDAKQCSVIAPRGHAKSTAFTHDYALAVALFRDENFIVIVSATEDLAKNHLGDIAKELRENEELRQEFGIVKLVVDATTELVCRCDDGYEFRFVVRGSGQKMRGLKWRGKRPGLILCDDLEEDEQVENQDRRKKFRRWFNRALLPCLRVGGKVRVHGTILHEDAILARIRRAKSWKVLFFKAHEAFDDFTNILWPARFDEAALREIRQTFIDDGDAAGYSQEYLNDPFDNSEAYLRKEDFLAMTEEEFDLPMIVGVGVDFAISKKTAANRTSFTVGGKDIRNLTYIIDERVGRWNSLEIIEMFFTIQERWSPDAWFVEDGQIWKAVKPMLEKEMLGRDKFLFLVELTPITDKASRGRTFQKRHAAGAMRFNKEADWYEPYEAECLRFTGTSDAVADDQFDSTATLMLGFEKMADVSAEDFQTPEEEEFENSDPRKYAGRSAVTGY